MAIHITPGSNKPCSSCSTKKRDRFDIEISGRTVIVITLCEHCLRDLYEQCNEIYYNDYSDEENDTDDE